MDNLFKKSSTLPKEFHADTKGLSQYEKNKLVYAGTEAIWLQIKETVLILIESDPNAKTKIREMLKANLANLDSHILDDINKLILLN